MRASLKAHLATVSWSVVTAIGLLAPGTALARVGRPPDWVPSVVHFLLFLGMALLLFHSLAAARGGTLERRHLAIAFGIALLYGVVLEAAQLGIEGREFDWRDLVVNGSGALAGVVGVRIAAGAGTR